MPPLLLQTYAPCLRLEQGRSLVELEQREAVSVGGKAARVADTGQGRAGIVGESGGADR